ncbi:MAG: nitroreductase family protein [Nitrososphaerales archaeon]
MDTYESITTKRDVREFAHERVQGEIKRKILEAARLTGSSMNTQHWRFILVQDRSNLERLAADSTSGGWVANADFAVVILTNPKVPGSTIDGGRVLQDMELAAWNFGVVSCLYTGIKRDELRRDFGVPQELEIPAVLGFGYPKRKITGKKDRRPMEDLVSPERFGNHLSAEDLA